MVSVHQIHLICAKRDLMAQFLSELLDIEITWESDSAIVELDHFRIQMVQTDGRVTKKQAEMAQITFSVENEQELFRLSQKIEFYNYRHLEDKKKSEQIHYEASPKKLSFIDMDHRKWHIVVKS